MPVLAIFANPHTLEPLPHSNASETAAMARYLSDHTITFMHAFQMDVPTAQVISIPNADHYIYKSNDADVLKNIDFFMAASPR